MSHGYGVQQRLLLDALEVKARERFDEVVEDAQGEFLDSAPSQMADMDMSRARWRWYTIELLGLTGPATTRAERVSLHRAINSLGNAGELEVRGSMPYGGEPFTRIRFNPAELSRFNPRWPHRRGRVLWFRRPPPWDYEKARLDGWPEELPEDDGSTILDFLDVSWPDWFADFCGAADRERRWQTLSGAAVVWLFCGELPVYVPAISRAR